MTELSRLRLRILAVLSAGPLHGYGIRQEIKELTAQRPAPSMATMYAALGRLVDGGFVERGEHQVISGEKVRKLYRITTVGHMRLTTELMDLERLRTRATPPEQGANDA